MNIRTLPMGTITPETDKKQPLLTENKLNTLTSAIINMFFPDDTLTKDTESPTNAPSNQINQNINPSQIQDTPPNKKTWIFWAIGGGVLVVSSAVIWHLKSSKKGGVKGLGRVKNIKNKYSLA